MTQLFHTFTCVYCSAVATVVSPSSLGPDLQYPVTETDVTEDFDCCAESINWPFHDCCPECTSRHEDAFQPSLD